MKDSIFLRRRRAFAATLAALSLALSVSGCAGGVLGDFRVIFLTDSPDTKIVLEVSGTDQTIDIHSQSGIGEAVFWFVRATPEGKPALRLYVNGLEQLTVQSGEQMVRISVSSHGDHMVHQALLKSDGTEEEITSAHTYWVEVKPVVAGGGQPLYFDIRLPTALTSDSATFRIQWIDFFR